MASPTTSSNIPVDSPFPATSFVIYSRLIGLDGNPLTQATTSTITYVIHVATSASSSFTGTLTVASVIFDSLQTSGDDARWGGGDDGFNFRWSIAASLAPTAGVTFRYRVKITATDGSIFYVVRDRKAKDWGGPAA